MNLREDKVLRAIAHAALAFVGVALLGTGLAMLSGATPSGEGSAATALVMMRPLPHDAVHAARRRTPQRGRSAEPAEPRSNSGGRQGSEAAGRLAIVIDDIGHTVEAAQRFLALGAPLTYSILPDVPHARDAARAIHAAGREYLIHLPMQPFDYPAQNPGPYPLLLAHGMEETARRVRAYLDHLPGATGASNHMGSAYTYDADRMRVVQTVLAERRLFFLNSRTSATPVPAQVARRWGYSYLERDVFLDHDPSERAIERAFLSAVRVARVHGRAIAVGHPYPQTLRVLKRQLPRLAGQGVKLVSLSTLLGRRVR